MTEPKTLAEQLEAMNGKPLDPLTPEQAEMFTTVSGYYLAQCAKLIAKGAPIEPPANMLLAVLSCANEVVSYNRALAEQARRDGAGEPDKPVMH